MENQIDFSILAEKERIAHLIEQEKSSIREFSAYAEVEEKLAKERAREYDASSIIKKRINPKDFTNLISFSSILTEVQRYKEIADYFALKSNRERYNSTNSKYLQEMHDRLLIIQGETLPQHISGLCSILLKRFDAGII